MPTNIERDQVLKLLEGGAQIVEVLPSEEYNEEHLPGAINIPLRILTRETIARLDPAKPTVTYCYDYQ